MRETFVRGREQQTDFPGINNSRAEFERWLAAHDAEVRLAALEEIATEFEHTRSSDPGTDWFYADAAKWIRANTSRSYPPEGSN